MLFCRSATIQGFLLTHSLFPKHQINVSTDSNGKEGTENSNEQKNLNRSFDPLSSDR